MMLPNTSSYQGMCLPVRTSVCLQHLTGKSDKHSGSCRKLAPRGGGGWGEGLASTFTAANAVNQVQNVTGKETLQLVKKAQHQECFQCISGTTCVSASH